MSAEARKTLSQAEWEVLVSRLKSRNDVTALARNSNGKYTVDTLNAIYQQAYTRQMIRTSYLSKQYGSQLVARYEAGDSLLDISEWINLSPCMVARRVMELHFGKSRQNITKLLRNTSLIEDERLQREVIECIDSDEHSGPRMDRLRTVLGLEYEHLLCDKLRNLRLAYETENDLRARGTHKTPDVLLRVPVGFQGKVVRWIDSKAKFGDEYTLNKDYSEAVNSYVGRFGPGMVIYWFGFVSNCDAPIHSDAGVLVVDSFPTDVVTLPGSTMPD